MKKIIIFGATGNIGAYFVDYCIEHLDSSKYEIIAVGRKETDYYKNKGIKYCRVDITKDEDFNSLPADDIYAIVNLAGVLPAYLKDNNPFVYANTNILGSLRMLEYARKNNADRFLYSQTWAEQAGYWGKKDILSPDMPRKLLYTGDHAFYTITKTTVVETMEYYRQEFGIKSFVFRLPNVYLYNPETEYYVDGEKHVIAYRYMIERAIKGEPIELWGSPDAYKDILYVKDLCQMMFKALFVERDCGLYNAGTGIKTTLKEQIEGIIDVFSPASRKSEIIYRPEKANFVSFVMDIENARLELGYDPQYGYKEYLMDYMIERDKKKYDMLWK
ncbi:NAD-dependent epimerase/dehydratase family protein [Butyrivibrio sp. VCB2006]|uniref:NAD-dependent epimerase/dehydratase family protein n=1 Tax=Butyrivibrio sp. VCB2006 TaxID=1280679 RepID=UPI0004218EA3|nr:NAD(P)-dependent oxidoreductase [Butyrivibrio sp. VCB2006]